jgi:hypothetical protein
VAWSGVVGFLMSERTSEIPHRWRTARKRQKRPGGSDRGCRRRAEAAGPDSVLRGGGQGARVRRHAGGEDWSGQRAHHDASGGGIRGALSRQRRKLACAAARLGKGAGD